MWRYQRIVAVLFVAASLSACSRDPEQAKQEYLKSGDRYVEQGKYNEAIVQYRNALQQDPRFGHARYRLAEAHAANGDPRNAAREYIRAADLMPANSEAQIKAGTVLLRSGQFEDAKTRAQQVVARDPKNVEAHILLGNAMAGLRQFDEAVQQLEEAIAIEPSQAGYASLGAIHLGKGSREQAESAFRRAVQANPRAASAHRSLAGFLWATGRRADAEAELKTAHSLAPDDVVTNRGLVAFYLATGRGAEAEPHLKKLAEIDKTPGSFGRIALADYYVASNRTDEALRVLEPLTTVNEASAPALTRIATIQYSRKLTADAHRSVDRVLDERPKFQPAQLAKASFLLAEHKPEPAITLIRDVVAANPSLIQAHFLLGKAHMAAHRPKEAVSAFNEVLRLNPQATIAQLELAQARLAMGEADAAVQLTEQATRNVPDNAAAQLLLARSLVAKRDFRRAQAVVRRLLPRFGNVAAVHAIDGTVKYGLGDKKASRVALQKALDLDPANLEALAGLTALDSSEGRGRDAETRLMIQLNRDPKNAELLMLAARLELAQKDTAAAENHLKKAIESNPAAFGAYAMLGNLYGRAGRLDEARRTFEALAERQPDSVSAQTVVAMLYEAQNNKQEARKRYERIVEMDRGAAVAANNLAWLYVEDGGNLDVALQLAQTATSHLPDSPEVNDTLGWVYYRKDLATLAIPPLLKAATAAPENAMYQYHLGMAYMKAGEKQKGQRALTQALALNPGMREAAEVRTALNQ
jgi:tetratricopeptide (TPR) repeat protein